MITQKHSLAALLSDERGYISLVSVMIISAVALSISISLLYIGAGHAKRSLVSEQTTAAMVVANSCAEEALQQIRANESFSGSGNLSLLTGDCSYSVTVLSGPSRQVEATSTVGNIQRKLEIEVSKISPLIIVDRWEEVADIQF